MIDQNKNSSQKIYIYNSRITTVTYKRSHKDLKTVLCVSAILSQSPSSFVGDAVQIL